VTKRKIFLNIFPVFIFYFVNENTCSKKKKLLALEIKKVPGIFKDSKIFECDQFLSC